MLAGGLLSPADFYALKFLLIPNQFYPTPGVGAKRLEVAIIEICKGKYR